MASSPRSDNRLKLTDDEVRDIRRRAAEGEKPRSIAHRYLRSYPHIYDIIRGLDYKNVGPISDEREEMDMAKQDDRTPEEKRAFALKKRFQKELDTACGECGKHPVISQLAQELEIDKAALWRFANTNVILMEPSLKKIERWVDQREKVRKSA